MGVDLESKGSTKGEAIHLESYSENCPYQDALARERCDK